MTCSVPGPADLLSICGDYFNLSIFSYNHPQNRWPARSRRRKPSRRHRSCRQDETETGEQLPDDSASGGGKIGPVRLSSCRPLGRTTRTSSQQSEETQRDRGDISSTETLSAGGRYGGDAPVGGLGGKKMEGAARRESESKHHLNR